ncbi:hypothetical protein [Tamlana flava]|uniref:hypothetical protein n=1 Tax=Tamlana flava TaxID=3158572 RepID=UPI00351B14CA
MNKSKVLIGFVLLCYILFAVFELSGNDGIAYYSRSLIVPLITLIYLLLIKDKKRLFLLFLVFYSISDLMGLVIDSMPFDESGSLYDFNYYSGNLLYMISYLFLVIKICKSISFKHILKHYLVHAIVLIALNIYFIYVLQVIISPNLVVQNDYYFELAYNIVALLLLPLSLLNYFYRDNKKSLYLFLGSLCIVFSEVMDVAYIYISERGILNFLSTTLILLAFYLLYQQSKLNNVANKNEQFMFVD